MQHRLVSSRNLNPQLAAPCSKLEQVTGPPHAPARRLPPSCLCQLDSSLQLTLTLWSCWGGRPLVLISWETEPNTLRTGYGAQFRGLSKLEHVQLLPDSMNLANTQAIRNLRRYAARVEPEP